VPGIGADDATASTSIAELAAAVSALQVQLVGVTARVREGEVENQSLRESIANLANENQLLKRRMFGNKTERGQTSELQLALGNLLDADQRLQKQLDEAVAKAKADGQAADEVAATPDRPKGKPSGRRDLLASNLPRFLLEIFDEDLEKTAKRFRKTATRQAQAPSGASTCGLCWSTSSIGSTRRAAPAKGAASRRRHSATPTTRRKS